MMHKTAPRNVQSATGIPRSLTEAILFLTRPLVMFYTPHEISIVQNVLQTTLTTAYFSSPQPRLSLTLSPTTQPPRPLIAACVSAGVQWADWLVVLGGKELDVLVEPSRAVIRFGGQDGALTTIWQEHKVYRPPQLRAQVPPSLLEARPLRSSLRATVDSAIARVQGRTKAQELLEFNDKEEADEIFALLSNVTGVTPTPTRDHFQLDDPTSSISSPESSRPSSRSSNYSRFSFDSSTSSAESMTSVSTTSSSPIQKVPAKSDICSSPEHPTSEDDASELEPMDDSNVYVDKSKKTVHKFLYQGGVSTVLSGGVMLGAAKKTTQVSHNEKPVVGKLQASFDRQSTAPVNGHWRRL